MGSYANLTDSGFTYLDYPTTLATKQNEYLALYPSANLDPSTQDGQFLAIEAQAIYDTNQLMAAVLQSLSPTFASGVQLSNEVLINGITRNVATNSTVNLTITGVAGTIINGASAKDANNIVWNITNGVIPVGGSVILVATCAVSGAITALANTITVINTPIAGWSTVTNVYAATAGAASESDSALRQRQAVSVAQPSQTNLTGVLGGILAIIGVVRAKVYENYTTATDSNGLPAKSICAVVDGGDGQLIANTIAQRKTIGCQAYGTTAYTAADSQGVIMPISYTPASYTQIGFMISIQPLANYTSQCVIDIEAALVAYINSLGIGATVYYSRLFTVINQYGAAENNQYFINNVSFGVVGGSYGTSNVAIAYSAAAACISTNITITAP